MKLTIEPDRALDGHWIAEVPELNVLLRSQSAALETVLDRTAHGELSRDSANAVFDVAA